MANLDWFVSQYIHLIHGRPHLPFNRASLELTLPFFVSLSPYKYKRTTKQTTHIAPNLIFSSSSTKNSAVCSFRCAFIFGALFCCALIFVRRERLTETDSSSSMEWRKRRERQNHKRRWQKERELGALAEKNGDFDNEKWFFDTYLAEGEVRYNLLFMYNFDYWL